MKLAELPDALDSYEAHVLTAPRSAAKHKERLLSCFSMDCSSFNLIF